MRWYDSLTGAQRIVLALALTTLLVGFWVGAGGLSASRSETDRQVEYVAPHEGAQTILVHVVGAVQRPDVYELPAGARVMDAITAAGGFAPGARRESVNLAAFCEDGEQVYVEADPPQEPPVAATPAPRPEPAAVQQTVPTATPSPQPPASVAQPAPRQQPAGTPTAQSSFPEFMSTPSVPRVRLNYAGLEELQEIPGVGPALAKNIIYHRAMHGPFRSFQELDQVEGIGPSTIAEIRLHATLN